MKSWLEAGGCSKQSTTSRAQSRGTRRGSWLKASHKSLVRIITKHSRQSSDGNQVRTIISLDAQYDMEIHQMDVETAFLIGWLDEEIYFKQPEGFASPGQQNLVCKLKRSLYDQKQSPRCWNEVLHEQLVDMQFL